ncbi:signal peptidase I [Jatrophihabitans endophyticus]|uniref:signal peptidase I n=1 Tax=Jatrophihabitans endophyticus TaxID=1206085 RepID=UPI0009355099|nr:signal peptidase I [Jatrophihabitans endophyticus]
MSVLVRVTSAALACATLLGFAAMVAAHAFLHVSARTVLTGSMRPTYQPGDMMLTVPRATRSLQVGQIAVLVPPGQPAPVAHRIVAITHDRGGRVVLHTRGDANPADDPWHAVPAGERVPVVIGHLPRIGRLAVALQGSWGRYVLVVLLGLGLTWGAVRRMLRDEHCTDCCPDCSPAGAVASEPGPGGAPTAATVG